MNCTLAGPNGAGGGPAIGRWAVGTRAGPMSVQRRERLGECLGPQALAEEQKPAVFAIAKAVATLLAAQAGTRASTRRRWVQGQGYLAGRQALGTNRPLALYRGQRELTGTGLGCRLGLRLRGLHEDACRRGRGGLGLEPKRIAEEDQKDEQDWSLRSLHGDLLSRQGGTLPGARRSTRAGFQSSHCRLYIDCSSAARLPGMLGCRPRLPAEQIVGGRRRGAGGRPEVQEEGDPAHPGSGTAPRAANRSASPARKGPRSSVSGRVISNRPFFSRSTFPAP